MNMCCFILDATLFVSVLAAGCTTDYNVGPDHKKVTIDHLVFESVLDQYKEKPDDPQWIGTTSRIVGSDCNIESPAMTSWGGRTDIVASSIEGTDGYFRLGRVANRWVFVDPEGGVNIIRGTQNVAYPEGNRFGSIDDWSSETSALLLSYGFNHADFAGVRPQYQLDARNEEILNPVEGKKISHSIGLNMLRSFIWDDAKNLSWTYDDATMNRLNLIFESRYEAYLDREVSAICVRVAEDKHMLGYQLDNELGFRGWDDRFGNQGVLLHQFLSLPKESAAYQYAQAYVDEKKLDLEAVMSVTKYTDIVQHGLEDAYNEFRARVAEKYYKQYHDVIRKYDNNHLIFGSRLHSFGKYDKQTLQACAKYCDVITINYYGTWSPEFDFLANLRNWTGDRPFFVTEFYVKGEDANYDGTPYNNQSGGGWVVPTQIMRGDFYQNFCIGLLEALNCVGWTYFAYDDVFTGVSENNCNRGLVSARYYPWLGFLDGVGRLNRNVYAIMDYFDK